MKVRRIAPAIEGLNRHCTVEMKELYHWRLSIPEACAPQQSEEGVKVEVRACSIQRKGGFCTVAGDDNLGKIIL